jgi:hypothetical protein
VSEVIKVDDSVLKPMHPLLLSPSGSTSPQNGPGVVARGAAVDGEGGDGKLVWYPCPWDRGT